ARGVLIGVLTSKRTARCHFVEWRQKMTGISDKGLYRVLMASAGPGFDTCANEHDSMTGPPMRDHWNRHFLDSGSQQTIQGTAGRRTTFRCSLLAFSGQTSRIDQCPLLGVKRTSAILSALARHNEPCRRRAFVHSGCSVQFPHEDPAAE